MRIRRSDERGHADHGWLNTFHTFSFADYYDPQHMGFRALRVINQDRVVAGGGFPEHAHRDMEILSYVLEGALEHKDSMGNGSVIRPGDVQRMSAGTGVTHSEQNASKTDPVHFLQMWVVPEKRGLPPSYEQKVFPDAERKGRLRLIGSRQGRDGSLTIHQDVDVYASILDPGDRVRFDLRTGRNVWIQLARGVIQIGGDKLVAGDGASTSDAGPFEIVGVERAELIVFDLN